MWRSAVAVCVVGSVACLSCSAIAAQRQSAAGEQVSVAAEGQPAEKLDLQMYSRIRDEGFNHSHVMEYASALFDDIGARLTGSPAMARANAWTMAQLTAMGCANAHLESWGDFGMAWTQLGAGLEMVKPAPAVFLAQATPWSPALRETPSAEVISVPGFSTEAEFAKWKGKLKGKVILYGHSGTGSPDVDPDMVPRMEHDDSAKLPDIAQYLLGGVMKGQSDIDRWRAIFDAKAFDATVSKFFADQGALAVLQPGGSGGVLHDDTNQSLGWYVYSPGHKQAIPEEVISDEAWDRMDRLLKNKVPVTVNLHIDTVFGSDHEQGYNTIAEIPGTDPQLKDEVVMVGGHLDSWIGGTGATDNGAGTVTAMEAMRILNTLGIKPRRTIRIALWSGEEEGVLGSTIYVQKHFATFHYSTDPKDANVPLFIQPMTAPPTMKPEAAKLDAYFNMDGGTGKLLGINAQGNEAIAPIFEQWMAPLHDLGMNTVTQRTTDSTDHVPFHLAGLPGFSFIQDPRDYQSRTHHTSLDTYEHVSEPDLKQAAVVEAIFLYNAAMRDGMLPRSDAAFGAGSAEKPLKGLYPDAAK